LDTEVEINTLWETIRENISVSAKIIRMVTSRRIRLAVRVALGIGYWWESHKERDQLEDKDVGGRITLRWILELHNGVIWTGLFGHRLGTNGRLL
jgi:hypothetical protein